MEVPWWFGVTEEVMVKLNSGQQGDQENYVTNRQNVEHSENKRRLPLREINQTRSNIPTQQFTKSEGDLNVKLNDFHDKRQKHHPANISIRNERERNRVKLLNLGFERLRAVVPHNTGEQLSKISTLKKAIWYIEHLDRVLHGQDHATSGTVSLRGDPAGATTSQSSSTGSKTGRTAQQTRKSRRSHQAIVQYQSSSPQTAHIDPVEASCSQEAGNLAPGMTSWTPLPRRTTRYQDTDTQSCLADHKPSSRNAIEGSVKQQGPLSPIFPKQWGSTNAEFQTPPKNTDKYKTVHVNVTDYAMTKTPTYWPNSTQVYDSGYESPAIGPEYRIVR